MRSMSVFDTSTLRHQELFKNIQYTRPKFIEKLPGRSEHTSLNALKSGTQKLTRPNK